MTTQVEPSQPSLVAREPSRTGRLFRAALPIVLLICVPILVYGQVRSFALVYDDKINILLNRNFHPVSWNGLIELWKAPFLALYIPLTYMLWAAVGLFSQVPGAGPQDWIFDPAPFHIANLALHVISVLLVYGLLMTLVHHRGAACAGALLFALHPLQVESVAWVTEAKILLAAVFSWGALWGYLKFARTWSAAAGPTQRPGRVRALLHLTWATALWTCALLSQPQAVAVPLIAFVLDWAFVRRSIFSSVVSLVPWVALAMVFILATRRHQAEVMLYVTPLASRPAVAGDALFFYLWKFCFPFYLCADYSRNPTSVLADHWAYVTSLVPLSALLLLGIWTWRTGRREMLAAVLIFVAGVAPVLGLVVFQYQYISTVADRYVYLAMFGAALGLTCLLAGRWSIDSISIVAAALSCYALLSYWQTSTWHDERTLFSHAIQVNPRSALAHNNLGLDAMIKGNLDEATTHFEAALSINPNNWVACSNLGAIHLQRGNATKANEYYTKAIESRPETMDARNGVGVALTQLGRYDEALEQLRYVLKEEPENDTAKLNLAMCLRAKGELAEAERYLLESIERAPDPKDLYHVLAQVLLMQRRTEDAEAAIRKGIELELKRPATLADTSRYNMYCTLGDVLMLDGQMEKALNAYQEAVNIQPGDPLAVTQCGIALAKMGQLNRAADRFRVALDLNPNYVKAYVNLGMLDEVEGKTAAAVNRYRAALAVEPHNVAALNNLAWILATHPKDEFRDGTQAVLMAERALAGQPGVEPSDWDTLAAAYAEVGRFAAAVEAARRGRELARRVGLDELADEIAIRGKLYEAGKPYRSPEHAVRPTTDASATSNASAVPAQAPRTQGVKIMPDSGSMSPSTP